MPSPYYCHADGKERSMQIYVFILKSQREKRDFRTAELDVFLKSVWK